MDTELKQIEFEFPIIDIHGKNIGVVTNLDPIINNEEYSTIANPFNEKYAKIINIQRIINQKQINKFLANEQLNIQRLYHYPNPEFLNNIIIEGLDARLSKIGNFGKGIYFASDLLKANQFNTSPVGQISYMFLCSVNLGNTFNYELNANDMKLVREPDGYDSVSGNINGFDEFVVYDNTRVVIDYIISYIKTTEMKINYYFQKIFNIYKITKPYHELPLHLQSIELFWEELNQNPIFHNILLELSQ